MYRTEKVQPVQTPEQADLLGISVRAADASCLNAFITGANELHDCIKRLKPLKRLNVTCEA